MDKHEHYDHTISDRHLKRLQNFIVANSLPFDAAYIQSDDFRKEFCLQHTIEGTQRAMGSFELCIGFLLGYVRRSREAISTA